MTVLITGGGGFIGSHLVKSQLNQGRRVRVADLHAEALAHMAGHPRLQIVIGDLNEPGAAARLVDGVDTVYHLASAHLRISVSDAHYREINVKATEDLLRAAHAAGVGVFVHCSSVGVFGDIDNPPADETTPCKPTTVYEQTKLDGERAALRAATETGLPVVVARPAWVFGPGCPRTRRLLRAVYKGRLVMVGDGRTLRHPIHVADAVRGLEACAEVGRARGGVYILAGKEPVAVAVLLRTIAEVVGVAPPRLRLPVGLAKAVGYALQTACKPFGIEPPISRRTVDFFVKQNAYSTAKAQRDLGFQARVELREGLAETWQGLTRWRPGGRPLW